MEIKKLKLSNTSNKFNKEKIFINQKGFYLSFFNILKYITIHINTERIREWEKNY